LRRTIQQGAFLDVVSTSHYKMTQMANVAALFNDGQVLDGDVFFTMDMWHPGLEIIPYMAKLTGVSVRLYAFLHAGTYTKGDFIQPLRSWGQYAEAMWVDMCDGIFVASEYHKRDFEKSLAGRYGSGRAILKVIVTGCPYESSDVAAGAVRVPWSERKNVIVFPHRWCAEKRPDVAVSLFDRLYDQRKDWEVLVTCGGQGEPQDESALQAGSRPYRVTFKPRMSKAEYYYLLSRSRVVLSTAEAEYFGYGMVEACTLGCTPVAPNRLCYPEVLRGCRLYNTEDEAVSLLSAALDEPAPVDVSRYDGVITEMLGIMGF
jgi:glycosyltransferase involved in cell wall biosynthesis